MAMKFNQSIHKFKFQIIGLALLFFVSATEIQAQIRAIPQTPPAQKSEDFTWWYVTLFVLLLGLAGAIFWRMNSKKAQSEANAKSKQAANGKKDSEGSALDADKELEWLRKNQKLVGKKSNPKSGARKRSANAAKAKATVDETNEKQPDMPANGNHAPPLPIFSINRLELARPFEALPISSDEDLMTAVEQSYDEFEEDEEVRDLAIRILAAFRKRNSVEALSQIALYDLSANLRSKAVSVLADFDHESVFEPILLANADPTREVRAAAARSLTKLSFNRADAWTRISETGEDGRTGQSARAAIESGFVDMSFDRLISKDYKQAYEAFALMALLIEADETGKIFNALETHRDINVRRALLHTVKVTKNQEAIDKLIALLEKNTLPIEFQEEVDKAIEEVGFVTA